MSIEATAWALKHAPVPDPIAHLTLIGLADHAADDGTGAWPSVETLANYARCSPRSVHRKLRLLEESGVISRGDQQFVAHLRGDRRPIVWDLRIDVTESHPAEVDGVTGQTSRGDRPGTHGVTPVADKPPMNHPEPSEEGHLLTADAESDIDVPVIDRATGEPVALRDLVLDVDDWFDEFWQHYPRKVGKAAARRAYVKARKRESDLTIIGAVVDMSQDPNLPEKKFLPHPSTWLNRDGWHDEPYPPRGRERVHYTEGPDDRFAEPAAMSGPEWFGGARNA